VSYYRDNSSGEPSTKEVPDADIALSGDLSDADTTDTNGTFSFDDLFGNLSVLTLDKYGSPRASDHNDAITSTDASLIAQHAVQLITLSSNQQIAGDVSHNGRLTAFDASRVAQFAVQLIDHFTVADNSGSDWKFLRCDSYVDETNQDCVPVDPLLHPSYSHNPLTDPESDDFYAILYGDVSGNWEKAGGESFSAEAEVAAQDRLAAERERARPLEAKPSLSRELPARLSLTGWPASPGNRFVQLVLAVDDADGILAVDLGLTPASRRVSIVDVQTTALTSEFQLVRNDVDGNTELALFGVRPLQGSGALLVVTVEVRGRFPKGLPISIEAHINEDLIPVELQGELRDAAGRGR
jgi:hypothetical protein